MPYRIRKCWIFVALALSNRLTAQEAERKTIEGRVLSTAAQPLQDVEVSILDMGKTATSSKDGKFAFSKVPTGEHRLRFRRIGYAMRDTTWSFTGADSLVIAMEPIAELDSVKIIGERRDFGMEDFERNRRSGFGTFFTRDDIAKFDGRRTGDMFEQTPGVLISRGSGGQAWIQGKGRSASIMGGGIQVNQQDANAGAAPMGCYATVYLDNARVYSRTSTGGGAMRPIPGKASYNESAVPLFDINTLPPNSIEAIEFYAGAAQIPARYAGLNTQCGVMVIHTRRPDKKPPLE
jgi:hypothetical protein